MLKGRDGRLILGGVKKATVLTPQDLARLLVCLFQLDQLDLGVAQICLWAYLSCARIVEVLTASVDVKGNRFRANKEQVIMHMLKIQTKGGKVKDAKASMLLKTEDEEKEFLEKIAEGNLRQLIETPPFENRWSDADSFVRRLKGLLKGTRWEYMNITWHTLRRCRITHLADRSPPEAETNVPKDDWICCRNGHRTATVMWGYIDANSVAATAEEGSMVRVDLGTSPARRTVGTVAFVR